MQPDEHPPDAAEATTAEVHDNSWSVNLEGPEHAESRERLLREAIAAVEQTTSGHHVNLVTHGEHGHPREYLFEALEEAFERVEYEYVEQCGCGGHVTRVYV
jgi:putative CGCGG family rSAM target protein